MRPHFALILSSLLVACGDSADGPRGEPCTSDGDCGTLGCVLDADQEPEDLEPLSLACDTLSEGAGPGSPCRGGNGCDHGICLLSGACALPCATATDCAELERCQAVFVRSSEDTLQPSMACVSVIDLPADADVDVDLLEDALSGQRDTIGLAPAQVDGGDTVYVLEHGSGNWPEGVMCRPPLCAARFESDGDPELLFDGELDYRSAAPPRAPAVPGDHVDPVVLRIDHALAGELDGAALSLTLDSEVPGDLRVTRVHRAQRGQRLDLNVFYVGALDWEPTGSRGPELLERALEVVDEIFAPADIFIGEVRQLSVPGELPMRGVAFPEGDPGAGLEELQVRFGVYVELPHLFMLSAGAGNSAINLFFVRDIAPRGGGEPEAEAGGIPGPPAMHGTAGSGIAISTEILGGDPESLGRTLAHELAHYLGLFHTSESTGHVYESLTDTPECRPLDDCSGHEANLLWWAKATGTALSEQQLEVLGSAAVLQ